MCTALLWSYCDECTQLLLGRIPISITYQDNDTDYVKVNNIVHINIVTVHGI